MTQTSQAYWETVKVVEVHNGTQAKCISVMLPNGKRYGMNGFPLDSKMKVGDKVNVLINLKKIVQVKFKGE